MSSPIGRRQGTNPNPASLESTAKVDDKKEMTLGELDDVIRKAEERLHKKKMEFDFVVKLDKGDVSKYILGAETDTLKNALRKQEQEAEARRLLEETAPPKDDLLKKPAWMDLPDRRAAFVELQKQLEKTRDTFYEPITKERAKELHEQLKKEKAKFSLMDSKEEYEKIADRYESRYTTLMKDQLRQEVERRRRNKFMMEIYEMKMTLGQKIDINNPKIWNKKPLDAKDSIKVSDLFKKKLEEVQNPNAKYRLDYETDITKKVDAYFASYYGDINLEREAKEAVTEEYKHKMLGTLEEKKPAK